MAVKGLSVAMRKYIESNTGNTIYLDDMTKDLEKWERRVVQNAMQTMLRDNVMPGLESVERGRVWRYRPRSNNKRMFEELAETKSGSLVIQDSDGGLWRAVPLE